MYMTTDELTQEAADLEMAIQHEEDARAQVWANHDDEAEAMIVANINQMRERLREIQGELDDRDRLNDW
jgi:hypothetical protein